MLDADVIGYQVDHQLHAARVQRIGQMLVIRESAEVRVDRVKIGGSVAVIGLRHFADWKQQGVVHTAVTPSCFR